MSRPFSSLPTQVPILPLLDQKILFPGLLLRVRVTSAGSTSLLNHVLRSDQATRGGLVLGCVPVRQGGGIAELIGEDGNARPALPAPDSQSPPSEKSPTPPPNAEYGCTARIKSLGRIDRSLGVTGFVVVVEGICSVFHGLTLQGFLGSESIASLKRIRILKLLSLISLMGCSLSRRFPCSPNSKPLQRILFVS